MFGTEITKLLNCILREFYETIVNILTLWLLYSVFINFSVRLRHDCSNNVWVLYRFVVLLTLLLRCYVKKGKYRVGCNIANNENHERALCEQRANSRWQIAFRPKTYAIALLRGQLSKLQLHWQQLQVSWGIKGWRNFDKGTASSGSARNSARCCVATND